MNNPNSRSDADVSGVPVKAIPAVDEFVPATTLPKLLPDLLDKIAHRLPKGRETLARTCFGVFEKGLLNAPAFRLQLDRQCCDRLLSPRVIAALRTRKCKLAITLELPRAQGSRLVAEVLEKLGMCSAVTACKLSSLEDPSLVPHTPLDCSLSLAQCLVDSFPALASLALHGYSISCSDLATLLSHPQLALQLGVVRSPDKFIAALQPLTQLQVLTITRLSHLGGLPKLLQGLPHLHTLQLPCAVVSGQEELTSLLAATQLTSIQLSSVKGLTSSRADLPCSWQRLELTGYADCASAAHLPLHTLTHPLVLGELFIRTDQGDNCDRVEAAVHNLTQACSVPVRINVLRLGMARQEHVKVQQLVPLLQGLHNCSWEMVCVSQWDVGAQNVSKLAPLCQGCTHLEFEGGSVSPSLEFWRQLVQLMPTVTHLTFSTIRSAFCMGSTSSAMHESLQLMAEQPWARWLDICILWPFGSGPACWQASPLTQPGKLRVWFKS
ncbi:hypothetical protein V8C86DRAFT_679229 [Haematococcus lacustris]